MDSHQWVSTMIFLGFNEDLNMMTFLWFIYLPINQKFQRAPVVLRHWFRKVVYDENGF